MSATEIIEIIKELPQNEVDEITAFLQNRTGAGDETRRSLTPAARKSMIKKILREHEEDFRLLAQ